MKNNEQDLEEANLKKSLVLKKLKKEWDLISDHDLDEDFGIVTIPKKEVDSWLREININFNQLQNILNGFKQKGLIKFEFETGNNDYE